VNPTGERRGREGGGGTLWDDGIAAAGGRDPGGQVVFDSPGHIVTGASP